MSLVQRLSKGCSPTWAHKGLRVGDDQWLWQFSAGKGMNATHTNSLHPFQIQPRTLGRNVAAHPMPPHTVASAVGWVEKACRKGILLRRGNRSCRAHNQARDGQTTPN
jgi:hypothetical protein